MLFTMLDLDSCTSWHIPWPCLLKCHNFLSVTLHSITGMYIYFLYSLYLISCRICRPIRFDMFSMLYELTCSLLLSWKKANQADRNLWGKYSPDQISNLLRYSSNAFSMLMSDLEPENAECLGSDGSDWLCAVCSCFLPPVFYLFQGTCDQHKNTYRQGEPPRRLHHLPRLIQLTQCASERLCGIGDCHPLPSCPLDETLLRRNCF